MLLAFYLKKDFAEIIFTDKEIYETGLFDLYPVYSSLQFGEHAVKLCLDQSGQVKRRDLRDPGCAHSYICRKVAVAFIFRDL